MWCRASSRRKLSATSSSVACADSARSFREGDSVVSMKEITDIDKHWAKNFIMDIVDLKIRGLEPYPDHTFHPQELVNRGEFAMMVEDAIIAILTKNAETARRMVLETTKNLPYERTCECASALKYAIITQPDHISPEKRKELEPLIGKYIK